MLYLGTSKISSSLALMLKTEPFRSSLNHRGTAPVGLMVLTVRPDVLARLWNPSPFAADTSGSSYDTYLAVWTGTENSLSLVGGNDDVFRVEDPGVGQHAAHDGGAGR